MVLEGQSTFDGNAKNGVTIRVLFKKKGKIFPPPWIGLNRF